MQIIEEIKTGRWGTQGEAGKDQNIWVYLSRGRRRLNFFRKKVLLMNNNQKFTDCGSSFFDSNNRRKLKMAKRTFWKRVFHKLFKCPTFWKLKTSFECPICGKKYRCYWDGNDDRKAGIDICNKCILTV